MAAHVWAIMEPLPLIRLRSEPQTPSPRGRQRTRKHTTPTAKNPAYPFYFPAKFGILIGNFTKETFAYEKFCAILFSFVLVLIIALPVAAEGESSPLADNAPSLTAPAAYVVNLDTNIVVYEKNSETPLSAASLTKLMTTLLLLENYQDQLDSISLTARAMSTT